MFHQQYKYQNHLKSHTKNEKDPYSCNICRKSFSVPARLTRHYRTHTGEKPFQCEYCSKSFSVKENLSVHRRIHTKERPYKCDICESAFEHSGKLHRHMRIHTGERPHKCSICNKTFIQSGQLVIHTRTHTGEKPYVCKSCGKGFTCSKQLKVHTRTHTGEKPYKCDICNKSFGYNHVLKHHQVSHYGEKCYKCTICQETFTSKKLMESHIKTHSQSSDTVCTTKNKFVFKNVDDYDKLLLCNYKNNYEIPIQESKLFNCTEIKKTYGSRKVKNQIDQSDSISVSEIVTDSRYLLLNSTSLNSKRLHDKSIDKSIVQEITVNNHISTHQCILSDRNPDNSCLYEIQNNEFFSAEFLKSIYLSSNDFINKVENNFDKIKDERQINSRQTESCEDFSAHYYTEINERLYSKSLNFVTSNKIDNHSLPPRKRCKMILESMNSENSKRQTGARYSVIRFAKSEIINSVNDTTHYTNI